MYIIEVYLNGALVQGNNYYKGIMITGIVVKNMNGYFYVQDDNLLFMNVRFEARLKKGTTVYLLGTVLRFQGWIR